MYVFMEKYEYWYFLVEKSASSGAMLTSQAYLLEALFF